MEACLFLEKAVRNLKHEEIDLLRERGWQLGRHRDDRTDCAVDFFMNWLPQVAQDPEIGLDDYSLGVQVAAGTRMAQTPGSFQAQEKVASARAVGSHA